MIKNHEGRAFT